MNHTKGNEDKLDAIIAAYTAAYFWRYGFQRSVILGSLQAGYIVTPQNLQTMQRYEAIFENERNPQGRVPFLRTESHEQALNEGRIDQERIRGVGARPRLTTVEERWCGKGNLRVVDNNIWCKHNGWMIRDRCQGWNLRMKFIEEDNEPELVFQPFERDGVNQGGLTIGTDQAQRDEWQSLRRGASNANPQEFAVCWRYEER